MKLYATGAATASAVASVTIPSASKIRQIQYTMSIDAETDADAATVELSKIPTSQIGTNGSQDPFFVLRANNNLVTSGMVLASYTGFVPLSVDCRQGEVIYLHAAVNSATYYFEAILFYE